MGGPPRSGGAPVQLQTLHIPKTTTAYLRAMFCLVLWFCIKPLALNLFLVAYRTFLLRWFCEFLFLSCINFDETHNIFDIFCRRKIFKQLSLKVKLKVKLQIPLGRRCGGPTLALKTPRLRSFVAEVESRTQLSRPRSKTQKNSEAKAKYRLFDDRPSRGHEQLWLRPRRRTEDTSFLNYGLQIFRYF